MTDSREGARRISERQSHFRWAVVVAAGLLPFAALAASSSKGRHSGKEVVDQVCAACHATGKNGAPKIGDVAAWAPRARQGLTSLTEHALNGLRQMPAHGGSLWLSDMEIARAITYMVNQSGGNWVEPIDTSKPPAERSGAQVVAQRCVTCHGTGVNGAPRVGHVGDWKPHLKKGVDILVQSAIHGHGGMPPRGGLADLSDKEVRNAVIYMITPENGSSH